MASRRGTGAGMRLGRARLTLSTPPIFGNLVQEANRSRVADTTASTILWSYSISTPLQPLAHSRDRKNDFFGYALTRMAEYGESNAPNPEPCFFFLPSMSASRPYISHLDI